MTAPRLSLYKNAVISQVPPRELEREGALLAQLASLTKPDAYDTTYLTHGIHPYPAKYIPQLPNLIIREHTNERHTVLDPFCGSGTSLLEAAILGRRSVGVDLNSVATLISSAKTTPLTNDDLSRAEQLAANFNCLRVNAKIAPPAGAEELNLAHWFQSNVIAELSTLRQAIGRVESVPLRTFLKCIFSSIVVGVSNQESETRYAAISKNIGDGEVFRRFSSKLAKELPRIRELSSLNNVRKNTPRVLNCDIREVATHQLRENTVDLVVTSPPYPNSFDYYLYHKWRLFWLGVDYKRVMNAEIGSRREHSSLKQPMANYATKMRDAMTPVGELLKPSKLAYFFVGDAVISGEFFDISDVFKGIVKDTNLRLVADTNYSLESVTRSFREKVSENCHGGRRNPKKLQHVLVFEKYNRGRIFVAADRKQATPNATTREVALGEDSVGNNEIVSLKSNDAQRHVHALGRYPSKYIPDIPRWAIEQYSAVGGHVLDPFGGSGTTAVEAVLLGRRVTSSDISPYSILLTKAKTCKLIQEKLISYADALAVAAKNGFPGHYEEAKRFELDDFWFPPGYLDELHSAANFIKKNFPPKYRDYFLAVLSTVVRSCSYQDEGQIKVKRDPKKVIAGTPRPSELLIDSLRREVPRKMDFLRLLGASKVQCDTILSSADQLIERGEITPHSLDLIVTSPPYINAMNYPMTHRYENIVMGLLSADQKRDHERLYFGSERVYAAEYRSLHTFQATFYRQNELNKNLASIFQLEPKRSYITYRFFNLMYAAMKDMVAGLKTNGVFVMVVGRNTIKGVPIDTFGYLVSMLESLGMKTELSFEYEIIKNAFKLTRHATADIIKTDGVAVLRKV